MGRQYCEKAGRNMSGNSKNEAAAGARIQWIDGVRAILTIWILLFHYTLSFINTGYVGFGKMKNRIPAYIGLFVFFFVFDQMYLCFLAGIIAADIVKSRRSGDDS